MNAIRTEEGDEEMAEGETSDPKDAIEMFPRYLPTTPPDSDQEEEGHTQQVHSEDGIMQEMYGLFNIPQIGINNPERNILNLVHLNLQFFQDFPTFET